MALKKTLKRIGFFSYHALILGSIGALVYSNYIFLQFILVLAWELEALQSFCGLPV